MMKNETSRIRPKPRKNPLRWVIVLLLILVYAWALAGVPFTGFKETAAQIMKAIVAGIFSPDWDFVYLPEGEDLLRGLLDTLAISVLGTVISAVLCIPFAFWSARNMSGHRSISGAGKMVLSFIRTFPEIIMALMFIKAVGPGSFAGVLALGLHSIGMLGKLYADEVENIDYGPSEALLPGSQSHAAVVVCHPAAGNAWILELYAVSFRDQCTFRDHTGCNRSRGNRYTADLCVKYSELATSRYNPAGYYRDDHDYRLDLGVYS